jgi:DNA-directed RNA polymerase sigma subunit (sigma70/sigma32)
VRKIKAGVSHHEREIEELAADRDLAVEYLRSAMQLTYGPATAEMRPNPHSGSNFDDFLREHSIFDETYGKASERARNERIEDTLQRNKRVGNKLPTLPS